MAEANQRRNRWHPAEPNSNACGCGCCSLSLLFLVGSVNKHQDARSVYPPALVRHLEGAKLPTAAQDAVLRHLCEKLGATEVNDLKDLTSDEVDQLVAIAPRLKQKV